jgi:serine acetyltransferase
VEFGVGAVAIGPIHIGSGTKIAPLSVVMTHVPKNSIVLGNPGKICPRIG